MKEIKTEDYSRYLLPDVISKVSSLDMKARLIVEGFLLGLHRSPYHGFSIEFSQHRPYMQGDAPKDIDWKVYGKTDRFFVKQYEEETNLKCYILLDVSKSMAYRSDEHLTKLDYASYLAASLAYLMLKQNDAVGLMTYASGVDTYLPPKAAQSYLKEILAALQTTKPSEQTNTAESLRGLAEKIKRRGMIIIISDFFDDLEKVLHSIKHFSFNKNEVVLFQILDPLEKSFAFRRDAIFKDMETGEEMTTQPHQIQRAYQDAMQNYLDTLKSECLKNRIEYNLIETSMPFDKALFAYLQKRSKLV